MLLAAVGVAALALPAGPLHLDQTWSEWMTDLHGPALDEIASVFNALGHGVLRALTIVAVGLVLVDARRWRGLAAFALVEAAAPLLGSALKLAVDRPRPPGATLNPLGSSFPSGHTVYAAATTLTLVALFVRPGVALRPWWSVAAAVTATMGVSRTYLQVHWLSDVLVGAALGAGVALGVLGTLPSGRGDPVRADIPALVDGDADALARPREHG